MWTLRSEKICVRVYGLGTANTFFSDVQETFIKTDRILHRKINLKRTKAIHYVL